MTENSSTQIDIPDGKELYTIFELLRNRVGVDFTYYKQSTIKRRIQRRLALHKIISLEKYLAYLKNDPQEIDDLYNDLLINVTNFFRDPQVFTSLSIKVFPQLIKEKSPDNPIRIWVPGCATGEEVYSMAMSLLEFLEHAKTKIPIQVFGTDISDDMIEKARAGLYGKNIEKDISPERLERFFTRIGKYYQINKTIREICIFARQNIVSDPPFSNIDLISCRNLLIYLEPFLQKRVMPIFHYALKPHGYLVLGNSETIGDFTELFHPEDKKNKIYVKKSSVPQQRFQLYGTIQPILKKTKEKKSSSVINEEISRMTNLQQEVDKIIVSKYAPAGVVVNNNLEIIQFKGHTSPFLEPSPGKASLNLLKMAREGLFLVLNTALKKARLEGKPVRKEGVQIDENGTSKFITLEVIPIKVSEGNEPTFLILFEDILRSDMKDKSKFISHQTKGSLSTQKEQSDQVDYLKQELTATREYLQSAIQELEATNEEVQGANEEILSNNEELQSVNEELETSKEELQSANEELTTLIEELHNKNNEINQINNDLSNLLMSVNIPIIMLDKELYIRRFTPGTEKVMNLISSDIGRPIGNIKPNISVSDLEELLQDAIHRDLTKELEIQDKQGNWYLMRVLPYKTQENKTEGVIMAFVDINELKKTEVELARAAAIVDSSDDAIISKSIDGIILSWNKGAHRLYGYTAEEIIGKPVSVLMPPEKQNDFSTIMKQLLEGKRVEHYETQRMAKNGKIIPVSITVSPIRNAEGKIIGASKIARDISEQKQIEENLTFLSQASKTLSATLDYKTTLTNVTKLAVPHIADWCTVDLLNEKGQLELVAVAHKDPKQVQWAKTLRKTTPIDMNAPTGLPHVLRTGKSEFYPAITDKMLVQVAKDEKELALLRKLGFTSVMVVPLFRNRKCIGGITFVTTETKRNYDKRDLVIAEELAKRASLAIEHAWLFQEEKKAIALRDEFISVASHELKTPITSMKMYLQGLQKRFEQKRDNDTLHFFAKIDDQINKLAVLINDLLNVSKIQHGKLEFNFEAVDLNEVVKETVDTIQETAKKHTIRIEGKITKKVQADRYRIYQVLTNLLTNALKYSPDADKVDVTLTSERDVAVVTVRDFGIGIDKQHQQEIFNPFYRVASADEKTYPGLGMGLYISSEIVKRHGGILHVESSKGKGSAFSLTLPYPKH